MALFETAIMAMVGSTGLSCPSSFKADEVWSSAAQRWLVIGEDHGTNEEPEAFFDIVCQASAKRIVTVAVEQAASEQGAIDSFIDSDGSEAARNAFLKSPIWYGSFRDGRSSHAYFLLFERLRLLQKAGRITSVIAFQPPGEAIPADYEKKMAVELVKQSPPNSLVIALVGGVHAMRTRVSFGGAAYLPMAGHLPASQTKSVALKGVGGKQWACQSPTECGPIDVFQDGGQPADGLTLTPGGDAPYTAVLGLGKSTRASEPQVPNS